MDLNDEDSAAISELVDDSSKAMDMQSFYRIFLEQQQKYRHLKDKRNMHWHPLIIRFALSVKYSSTSAYQTLQVFCPTFIASYVTILIG